MIETIIIAIAIATHIGLLWVRFVLIDTAGQTNKTQLTLTIVLIGVMRVNHNTGHLYFIYRVTSPKKLFLGLVISGEIWLF